MPRLHANAPALVANANGAWVAYAKPTKLTLICIADRTAQEIDLPEGEIGELGFTDEAEPRVVVTLLHAESTSVLAFAVPNLAPVAQQDFPGVWHALAFSGSRFLLSGADGTAPNIATVTTKLIVTQPLALRFPALFAASAPEGRMLVEQRGQLEFWDVENRRALFRLNLSLPPNPMAAGFAAHGRLLWVASADNSGRLDVFRFSDGRLQGQLALGGRILAADSQVNSARVAIVTSAKAKTNLPPKLVVVDLVLRDRLVIDAEQPFDALCLVDGATPLLALLDSSGIRYQPLKPASAKSAAAKPSLAAENSPLAHGATTTLAAIPFHAPTAPAAKRTPEADANKSSSPINSWRARLRGGDASEAAAKEPITLPTAANYLTPVEETTGMEPSEQPSANVAGNGAAYLDISWRKQLLTWSDAAWAGKHDSTLPWDETTLGVIARNLELDLPAMHTLALLYAGWLRGEGSSGIAVSRIAKAVPEDDDWSESLGRGQLAAAHLVCSKWGRLRLRHFVGQLLDGHSPRCPIIHTTAATAHDAAPPTLSLILLTETATPASLAAQAAEYTGRDIALIDTGDDAAPLKLLTRGLIEARIFGALPLVVWHDAMTAEGHGLALLGETPALVAITAPPPPALAHLPLLLLS